MKKINLFLAILFAFSGFGFSQSVQNPLGLTEEFTTNFTWDGLTDQARKIVYHQSNLYVNGHKSGTIGDVHSGIIKINTTGDTLFRKVDTTAQSISDLQFCIVGDKIFYLSSGNLNYLIIRNINGELLNVKKLESRMSFCEYGDSVIAVTSQNPARVKIFSQNGDTTRSFLLGYSLSQGFVSVKRNGNELWICGLYYSSGYSGFIEKRNIISGTLLWRRNSLGANPIYATIDTAGNAYVTISYLAGTDSIVKIGPTGNMNWSQPLSQDFYAWDIAIDTKNQIAIAGGVTTIAGKDGGYVIARKMESGDSVFAFPVLWNAVRSNGITGVACDTSGNFYITGYDYTPTTCHVRKYHYDTMTGITVLGNENPIGFNLFQNYPNPFNPTTKIDFAIPKKEFVKLTVYDLLGEEVATLVNEEKNAGKYVVDFNGSKFSSGTYFYKIQAGEYIETKGMILLK